MEEKPKLGAKLAIIAAVLVVLIGVGAAVYVLMNGSDDNEKASDTTSGNATVTDEKTSNSSPDVSDNSALPTIVFTDDGFDKSVYTFADGTAIRVKNESSMDVQFSSADHPTHKEHPELNMDVLGPGESGIFTPPGKGTYGFHDHINDEYTGTLVIE